ncbi:MAG: transglutaminase-like enzyme, predicted cysteine protease [Methanobacterium sp. Maddingley MBC34]|nr:MAG: transglutaminase-like enzyme, predicted cysteine protease [Methanobacterium sp. Maddingley MBC34]
MNIQGIIVNQATFQQLMITAVININNSDSSSLDLEYVKLPGSVSENLNSGSITLNEYLQIAQNIKNYVKNNNNKAPTTISTSLGNIGFQSLLYMYCRILNHHQINNQLPGLATVRGWSVANIPIMDEFFTIQQITSVASEVKSFVDVTKSLPEYIKIGGLYVNQSQFLYLITSATLNINNENDELIILSKATIPQVINEDMVTGSLMIDEYVQLAQNIKTYIETNEKTPSEMSTSLGLVGYKSLIYMYSRALNQYNLNHALPVLITLKAWSSANIPIYDNSKTSFTLQEISNTAGEVKSFVDTTKNLPNFITISGLLLNQAQFLHLLTAATILINSKSTTSANLFNVNLPFSTTSDALISGTINTTSYVQLAQTIKTQIETNNRVPSSMTLPLGQISFKSMVYMYSRVLNQYRLHQTLPALINVKNWSTANLPIYDDYFTNREISATAGQVKAFVEATYSLPEYITVSGVLVNQAQFLYLLTTTTVKINNNDTTPTSLQKVTLPSNESEIMVSGSMNLNELLQLAQSIKTYIESNQKAQGSVSGSLGEISFHSLIYTYSRILEYYNINNRLPSSVTNIRPWALIVYNLPSGFEVYINPSSNCQSNDARIIALAKSITAGAVTPYEKALLIFNWVRDEVEYEFYYNTAKGAVGTMDSRGGNCCDIAHLIVALSRASGLAARYEHGNCFFTYSQTWYGHVWAEIYVNGWVTADGSNNYNEFGIINNWDTGSFALKGTYASLPF